jgi:hypothetical protein
MERELTEEEQIAYEKKKSNYFYCSDYIFEIKRNSYSLEERKTIFNYLTLKIENLKIKLNLKELYLKNIYSDLEKRNLTLDYSKNLSEEKLTEKNTINLDFFDKFYYLKISDKDFLKEAIIHINKTTKDIVYTNKKIKKIEEERELFKDIEIKDGYYLIPNYDIWLSLEDKNINVFNSIFLGENIDSTNNLNDMVGVIPSNKTIGDNKIFIAKNGKGGYKGGLFKKEIEATSKEEALFKLNEWAKREDSKSWSLFRMTQLCSGGFIRIYEKKEEIIK